MAFREEHELHRRRWGRNLALGAVLAAFVALIFGLTIVKVGEADLAEQLSRSFQGGAGQ